MNDLPLVLFWCVHPLRHVSAGFRRRVYCIVFLAYRMLQSLIPHSPSNGESLDVTRRDGNAMELEIDQHRAINGEM